MATKQAPEHIVLTPLPEAMRTELEYLFGTIFGPREAADHLRTIIEHVLFTGNDALPVDVQEALRVPWHIMNALRDKAA
jgi:hypothetical protein